MPTLLKIINIKRKNKKKQKNRSFKQNKGFMPENGEGRSA
jgi:hypothetical protein